MSSRIKNSTDIRSIVSKLDAHCRKILSQAADLAYKHKHAALDIEHVLASFCDAANDSLLNKLITDGFDVPAARRGFKILLATLRVEASLPPALSDCLIDALRDAWLDVSLESGDSSVSIEALLRGVVSNEEVFARLRLQVPALGQLAVALQRLRAEHSPGDNVERAHAATHSTLACYTIDLTERAMSGNIDPVIGRDAEISQVIEILLRRRQNNPILTGEAGVGKTAIVEGLALRIAEGLVPRALKKVQLRSLDMGLLRAGAAMKGEIESRIKGIIAEIATAEWPVILFIDEAHTLVAGSGGQAEQSDIANLIKPELARGTLRTIAATTWTEYKRYFEKDAALSRRFQTVRVDEPSVSVARDILQGLVPVLQKHHGVYVMQSAIDAAVRLSSRYIQGRQLPDKAISVLDTACARAVASLTGPGHMDVSLRQHADLLTLRLEALQRERGWTDSGDEAIAAVKLDLAETLERLDLAPLRGSRADATESTLFAATSDLPQEQVHPSVVVGSEEVASVIADWTGVPSQKMLLDQFSLVACLEDVLGKRVVGQNSAVHIICDRIRAYSAKLEDPSRPIGVFMLAGPSGVGKTETAHALAEAFFGPASMTVVNMSEYQEAHTVSKLKGAPAGYVGFGQGGVLTEAIRRQPYGLLLLDEVEKAHPDVLDLFLQVFDKGFMEDSEGVVVDFKNTLILMTSNVGSQVLESFGRIDSDGRSDLALLFPLLQQELLQHFKPAFLGRSQVVPYFPLTESELRCIVEMKMAAIAKRFQDTYRTVLEFDSKVFDLVVVHCVTQTIGARLIDQYISENILSRLSVYVLGCLSQGQHVCAVHVAVNSDGVITVERRIESTLFDSVGFSE